MAASPQSTPLLGRRGRLELDEMLAALVVDGLLSADDARQVRMGSRAGRSTVELHPLVVIANAKLPNLREPGRPLGLETLTEWVARQAGLPYLKIDPMKINVASVTQTVSLAYAQRHRILPVAASPGEITFATCEPFDSAWEALQGRWSRFNLPNLQVHRTIEYDVACNWKLLFQNYSECYHCGPVHPPLAKLTPPTSGENDLTEGPFTGGFMVLNRGIESMTMSGRSCPSRLEGFIAREW